MTRTLILTRHAKSSWDDPTLEDHDRPLNKRGVRSATALAGWFHDKGLVPDQVLSSSSERTRETWRGLALRGAPEFTRELFHASATQMFDVLSQATGETVLMLGHNPGIGLFADRLASDPTRPARFDDYPSGATAVLRFDIDRWGDLGWASGKIVDFILPRNLLRD